jgi:hypothetical protein
MPISATFNQPFDLQVRFLRRKLDLPTEKWTDIRKSAHDRAFVVAGAMKADLVADLHAAINRAAKDGGGLESFRKDFDAIVARHGWTGWTGEGSAAGRAWRTRVIYQTNMATSYAAGRWAQVNDPDLAAFRPYIKYHHADGVMHPRPQHVSWNGLVLPRDHPFWKTHAPPNGWGCHCFVSAASQTDYDKAAASGQAEPPGGWDAVSPKTGAPVGIDKGWDYAPGASRMEELRRFVAEKAAGLPPEIGAALTRSMNELPAFAAAAHYAGAVGEDFRRAVEDGLASIPDKVRQATAHAGWRVAAGPTLADIAPRLANEVPIGAAPGVTWSHIDGIAMPAERTIGVAESVLLLSGRRVKTSAARVGALLRHEHGHALDDAAIHAASRRDFMAAYAADAAVLREWRGRLGSNADAGRDLEKLLGEGGPREAFADLFAELHGGGTAASLNVARAMPRSAEAVRLIMEEWLK